MEQFAFRFQLLFLSKCASSVKVLNSNTRILESFIELYPKLTWFVSLDGFS